MNIIIDDERTFADGELRYQPKTVYARTSDEGLAVIAKAWTDYVLRYGNMVDLYLDHDLGENDTIMPVVDFLYVLGQSTVDPTDQGHHVFPFPQMVSNIFVHSQNPTAGDTIVPLLAPLYRNVKRIPLPELL